MTRTAPLKRLLRRLLFTGQRYTSAHNRVGAQMRACGKAGNRPDVVCTPGWVS